MKRGLVVFVLVIILLVGVIAASEVSEQVSSGNSESQSSSDSGVQENTDLANENTDTSNDISNSQIPASYVSDSNSQENNDVEDANAGHGNNEGCDPDNTGNAPFCNNEDESNGNSGNNNEEKITICHKPGTPAEKTMEIPQSALDGHLGHGDYVGECNKKITTENLPPIAEAGPDKNPYINKEVIFDGSASYDPDGTIVSYEWNFGDGSTGNGINSIHSYSQWGSYIVSLKVVDNNGLSDMDILVVQVNK